MKTITTILIAAGLFLGLVPTKKETVTITLTIDGLRNDSGFIMVALHNGESEFPAGEPYETQAVEAKKGAVEVIFKDVPAGDYAIAVAHDENNNEQMDFNEYGMPLEGFGFSNEAQAETGPPEFDAAAFDASEDTEEYIEIIYLGGY